MPTTGPAPDQLLTALTAESARQAEQLDAVEAIVRGLAADVAQLVGDRVDVPVVPCWVDLDAQAAAQAWEALRAWVVEVLVPRHPHVTTGGGGRQLPSCWYRHPGLVEELSALHIAWCAAYRNPEAARTAAIEWHDKWLPGVVSRIPQHAPRCSGGHDDDEPLGEPIDDGFRGFVMADVLSRPERPETE